MEFQRGKGVTLLHGDGEDFAWGVRENPDRLSPWCIISLMLRKWCVFLNVFEHLNQNSLCRLHFKRSYWTCKDRSSLSSLSVPFSHRDVSTCGRFQHVLTCMCEWTESSQMSHHTASASPQAHPTVWGISVVTHVKDILQWQPSCGSSCPCSKTGSTISTVFNGTQNILVLFILWGLCLHWSVLC